MTKESPLYTTLDVEDRMDKNTTLSKLKTVKDKSIKKNAELIKSNKKRLYHEKKKLTDSLNKEIINFFESIQESSLYPTKKAIFIKNKKYKITYLIKFNK